MWCSTQFSKLITEFLHIKIPVIFSSLIFRFMLILHILYTTLHCFFDASIIRIRLKMNGPWCIGYNFMCSFFIFRHFNWLFTEVRKVRSVYFCSENKSFFSSLYSFCVQRETIVDNDEDKLDIDITKWCLSILPCLRKEL